MHRCDARHVRTGPMADEALSTRERGRRRIESERPGGIG